MKSKIKRFICLLVFAAMLMPVIAAACNNGNGPTPPQEQPGGDPSGNYTVLVISEGGAPLKDIGISVTLEDAAIASGTTSSNGTFAFSADPAVYDVKVDPLTVPKGYTPSGTNVYKTSPNGGELKLVYVSSIIKEPIPDTKVYAVGDVMYDFTVEDIRGTSVTLSSILEIKKMVLINFWNLSCVPCISEMPSLDVAYRKYNVDAEVLAIDVPALGADDPVKVLQHINAGYTDVNGEKQDYTYSVILDTPQKLNMMAHVPLGSIPVSAVVDRYGVLVELHLGSMNQTGFEQMFQKYTADDYSQQLPEQGGSTGSGQEELVRIKPDKTMPASAEIEQAINAGGFNSTYAPLTGTADSEYSWPWIIDAETDGSKFIYPSNREVEYSYATVSMTFEITQADIDADRRALAFDMKYSCENNGDYFYVIVNNVMIYSYTGDEQWAAGYQPCYPLVATEAGSYTLTLMYNKDPMTNGGFDTVRVKNMGLITTSQIQGSLDMPRNASSLSGAGTGFDYVETERDSDGFYRLAVPGGNGPYILVDMFNPTNFNTNFENSVYSLSNFAVAGDFDYNTVGSDHVDYNPALDKTDAMSRYLMAANPATLPGLCVVTEELKGLLVEFAASKGIEDPDSWLQFCIYFEHYGSDPTDKGICDFEHNPVRGLLKEASFPMAEAHQGPFEMRSDDSLGVNTSYVIDKQYQNNVVIDRLIMPRGLKYLFKPTQSGVYRFRTQSANLQDTMVWLRNYDDESILVCSDEEREVADRDYNCVVTYYLEEGKQYLVMPTFADVGGTGEFTMTAEYLGPDYYVWEHVSRAYVTAEDDDMGTLVNFMYVIPVLDADGYYYDALRDGNGRPVDKNGAPTTDPAQYVADKSDPIWVDLCNPNYLVENLTIEEVVAMAKTENVEPRIIKLLQAVFNKPDMEIKGNTTLTAINDGTALSETRWLGIVNRIATSYGDSVLIEGEMYELFKGCKTVTDVVEFLQEYYLQAFNFEPYASFYAGLGYDAAVINNYTDVITNYVNQAAANQGMPDRDNMDRGAVRLDRTLQLAIELFARRFGWTELKTDWIRLCCHYEYMGGAQA